MTKIKSDKDTSCPDKDYTYLKEILVERQAHIRQATAVRSKRRFNKWLSSHYPELAKKVLPENCNTGVDATKLLNLLDLPVSSHCKTCGEEIPVEPSFRLRLFCSRFCMQTNPNTKEKRKITNIQNTGYQNPSQDPKIKEKKTATYLKKTGGVYDHPLRDPKVLAEAKKRYKVKTGYESPNQNPDVMYRQQKAAKTIRPFVDKHGTTHWCRGYEPVVLNLLDQMKDVKTITTKSGTGLLPVIRYRKGDRNSIYHPDIGVEMRDGRIFVIEVKSEWTLWRYEENNLLKFQAAEQIAKRQNLTFCLAVVCMKTRTVTWSTKKGIKEVTNF